ncbi:hypothetical protein EGW08_000633 [Elysia chlorotica]|uniref:Disease resistance R13L4/SHOC-2-like LRR domain-containing protein n=1 Tax=Elysia chlorotica TaxID=188477 RepID=A0A3S1BUM5_ELYCH|nr:hypothetical protein EGW08_000633 [Elysia chlorotica]
MVREGLRGATVMRPVDSPEKHEASQDHPTEAAERRLRMQVVSNSKGHMELNLHRRGLRQVPVEVFHMVSLHVLRVSHNHIDHLPMMISYLRSLRVLDVSHNLLVQLPETLVNCRRLTRLDLSHNRLAGLPRTIGGLGELRYLGLAGNTLEQLPQEFGQLSALRVLDLHGNRLWHLPPSLEQLRHLCRLDLGDNMLDAVPLVITRITSLAALDLSRNRLAALPVDIDQLRGLVELNLSHNKLLSVTSLLVSLTRLKYLNLASNGLKFLPARMDRLQNLEVLHVQGNSLRTIPALPRSLKYYNVSKNQLQTLTVDGMRNLVSLTATHNQLSSAPQGLYRLRRLRFLYLDHNRLEELSPDLALLTELRVLTLTHNDLRRLPHRALLRLDKLASFNIRGNHRLARRDEEAHNDQSAGQTHRDLDGTGSKVEDEANDAELQGTLKKKKKNKKGVVTTKGTITFHNENEENDELRGENAGHGRKLVSKSKVYSSRPYEDRPSTRPDTRFQEEVSIFPKSHYSNPKFLENYDASETKNKVKAAKRFNSLRSIKDIFFGRTKHKTSKHSARDRAESSINFETRAALRPSDSVHLPINYRLEEIERGEEEYLSENRRRPSHETRHWSLPRHSTRESRFGPGSVAESLYSDHTHTRNSQILTRQRDGYDFQEDTRTHHDTKRPVFHQGMARSNTMSPEFYHRKKVSGFSNENEPRNGGSVRGRLRGRPSEQYGDDRYNTLPFKHAKAWASQREMFHHGQSRLHDGSLSEPSWHQWGSRMPISSQPSREQSVREAYASFATETPFSEHNSTNVKAVYFPELDYSSASEDDAYTPGLRSYRSEPTFHSDSEEEPFDSYNKNIGNRGSRPRYPSDDSVFIQEEYIGRARQNQRSPSYRHIHHQAWRNKSPMSDIHLDQKYPGQEKSRNLEIPHSGDAYHLHKVSKSSLDPSRISDYVDCEDTLPPGRREPPKSHFQQFDHILSTTGVTNKDDRLTLGSPRLTPVALQHGHFLMKKKPEEQSTLTRSRSLDSILDYSPHNTSTPGQTANHGMANQAENVSVKSGHRLDPMTEARGRMTSPVWDKLAGTDYSLLGVCSHVESMLNKNALRPGIRFQNKHSPRIAAQNRNKTPSTGRENQSAQVREIDVTDHNEADQAHHSVDKTLKESALEYTQPQTFTLTSQGGQFVSSDQPEILVDVPAHAVGRNLNITMQLLLISRDLLEQAKNKNHFVSNILALGPLVHFHTDRPNTGLNSPATLTIPAPPAIKGGHLVVLSVRKDNSCLPVSNGYRSGHSAATMTTWHFSGKIALITRAKCKYKACKALEELLQCVDATQT